MYNEENKWAHHDVYIQIQTEWAGGNFQLSQIRGLTTFLIVYII